MINIYFMNKSSLINKAVVYPCQPSNFGQKMREVLEKYNALGEANFKKFSEAQETRFYKTQYSFDLLGEYNGYKIIFEKD